MSQKEDISALLDGELSEVECSRVFSSLGHEQLETWHTYGAIGDALRSSELQRHHNVDLLLRIGAEIEKESTILAPVLRTSRFRRFLQGLPNIHAVRRLVLSVGVVGVFAVVLNQAIPPIDRDVQMVRVHALGEGELTLWQEYFIAHRWDGVRSGLVAGVSMPRFGEAERHSLLNTVERVNVGENTPTEWMNVWQPSPHAIDGEVRFNYVSSAR